MGRQAGDETGQGAGRRPAGGGGFASRVSLIGFDQGEAVLVNGQDDLSSYVTDFTELHCFRRLGQGDFHDLGRP